PEQFGKTFLIEPVLASGVGSGAFAGRAYDAFPIQFERHGNRVLWVVPNTDFFAPAGSPVARSLSLSTGESVIGASAIAGEDPASKHVLFAPTLLLTDFEGIGAELGRRAAPPPPIAGGFVIRIGGAFSVDASRTYVDVAKALPANDELTVVLGFTGPENALSTVPDSRGFSIRMHYSVIAQPADDGYVPRLADDRVGYLDLMQKRYGSDQWKSPTVHYIARWDMRKAPIVFYLTDSIPPQYRDTIRNALLAWNDAFARIGIKHAIDVRNQPSDPAWDPDDARYSTVRWITSDKPDFGAYGGSLIDPYTGKILRASIVVDGEDVRAATRGYRDFGIAAHASPGADCLAVDCSYSTEFADDAAFGRIALATQGVALNEEEYARDWIRALILHESGHTLGLRHNFEASTLYSIAQLQDPRFTAAHGIAASVMDYLPVNISPQGARQASYFQLRLGPYDYWAIRYGYVAVPGVHRPDDERAALRAIARESSRRELRYGTDEDAAGEGNIDPRISVFDLSSDPLAYDEQQFQVSDELVHKLDRVFPKNDQEYYEERLSFATIMRNYVRAATLATRYIGGAYTSRSHRGQPGGAPPFAPIPRTTAHRAFTILANHVFSSSAFAFSPALMRDLGSDHFGDFSPVGGAQRPDFPVLQYIGAVQDIVLNRLFDPYSLARIADFEAEGGHSNGGMRLSDIFEWSRSAIWDDAQGRSSIPAAHRELQRRFTDLMILIQAVPSQQITLLGTPREVQALARYELRLIGRQVAVDLDRADLDVGTRAHLEDVKARIGRALSAANVQAI
ncbi:MAG: zinc-dependent metalloprotease, partial [Candidatus Eremiobacteraeota bacterium]|nr:zinc-dependent metalloprotease [Candidatus Eremiobacteraeota bacterium]